MNNFRRGQQTRGRMSQHQTGQASNQVVDQDQANRCLPRVGTGQEAHQFHGLLVIQVVQEQRTGHRVKVPGRPTLEDVMNKEGNRHPGLSGPLACLVDGYGAEITPGHVPVEPSPVRTPPEAQRNIAAARGHVQDPQAARAQFPVQGHQGRPQDPGTPTEEVEAGQAVQGPSVPAGIEVDLIHDFRFPAAPCKERHLLSSRPDSSRPKIRSMIVYELKSAWARGTHRNLEATSPPGEVVKEN